tara:strand:+ start:3221 stop:3427 length:207 start_codon:yes stop_codon:yes gene_type:complete
MTDKQPESNQANQFWNSEGLIIGISIGVALTVALDNFAIGIAIGSGVAAALGLSQRRAGAGEEDAPDE